MSAVDMTVDLGRNLVMRHPVMVASGTFGYGLEYRDLVDLTQLGAIVVKGLSLRSREGNRPPRIVETSCGMLNSIGLQNPGVEFFLDEKLPALSALGAVIIANVYGESEDEYECVVEQLSGPKAAGVAGLEINVSCPNVKAGGMAFGTREDMLGSLIERLRKCTDKHLMVKLSPNVTDIVAMARVAVNAGADSLSAINTLMGMVVDLENRRPVLGNATGGLSGPAIKPVALRMAWETAQAVNVPVIGIGGITSGRDALEFLCVGCRAVQVGTHNFQNPQGAIEIAQEMEAWLAERRISDYKEIIGTLQA